MTTGELKQPLVSCIMPTYNRRAFVPHAIRFFLEQDYDNKELLIVDDGTDSIKDLVPGHPQIRYINFSKTMTLGEKRNFCVKEGRGDLIMHWDDDDWYPQDRIRRQVERAPPHSRPRRPGASGQYRGGAPPAGGAPAAPPPPPPPPRPPPPPAAVKVSVPASYFAF